MSLSTPHSMQAIQNLGLAVVSLLAGMILDARGYILLEVFFLALLCGALITGVVLYMWDAAKGITCYIAIYGQH